MVSSSRHVQNEPSDRDRMSFLLRTVRRTSDARPIHASRRNDRCGIARHCLCFDGEPSPAHAVAIPCRVARTRTGIRASGDPRRSDVVAVPCALAGVRHAPGPPLARDLEADVRMAPGPGRDLLVSIPTLAGSVLVLLDAAGLSRPGWPIAMDDWCTLLLPVNDGSVRSSATRLALRRTGCARLGDRTGRSFARRMAGRSWIRPAVRGSHGR